jgi:hypothetical protein
MKCISCGEPTEKWGNNYKKYCSEKCHRKYWRDKYKKNYSEKKCKVCDRLFTPISTLNKYCGYKCKAKADLNARSKKPHTKKCKNCNKIFKPYTSLDKFCCANCRVDSVKSKRSKNWNATSAKNRCGKNNPAYIHGKATYNAKKCGVGERLYLKNRDEYRLEMIEDHGYLFCERCGITNTRFDMHHIIYRSEKPLHQHLHNKLNFINLCRLCHSWFHKSKTNRNQLVLKRNLSRLFGNDILNK